MIRFQLVLFYLITGFVPSFLFSQEYRINKLSSSTEESHEIHPVIYDGDLYFTSNSKRFVQPETNTINKKSRNKFKVYARDHVKNDHIYKIYEHAGNKKNVMSVSFCSTENIAFFTISNHVKNSSPVLEKSGIYLSRILNKWSSLESFQYNSKSHNIANPCFSRDGNRLYFESDMKGGFGGMDIWYCDRVSGGWSTPVNLGRNINSGSDEKTPFVSPNDELYYSSNKNGGLGGFDVYGYNLKLRKRIVVSNDINSKYDELGYFVAINGKRGCFSSNKFSDVFNVYEFYISLPDYSNCISSKKAKNCFTFYDPSPYADSLQLGYKWGFGDGVFKEGSRQYHCYEEPGEYNVKLFTFDKRNPNMEDIVSDQNLTVESSTKYYFDYKDSTTVNLSSANKSGTGIVDLATLFYYRNNISLTSFEEAGVSLNNNGDHVLTAFIENGDSALFCLTDTVKNIFERRTSDIQYFDLTSEFKLTNKSHDAFSEMFLGKEIESGNIELKYNTNFNKKEDFDFLKKDIQNKYNQELVFVKGDYLTPFIQILGHE